MSSSAWIIAFALLLFHQGSALLLDPDCGVISEPINGERFNPTPWLALIRTDKQKCSGLLIHQQYVITAASCLSNSTVATVRLGHFDGFKQNENSTDLPYEEHNVKAAIINYLFNETEYLNNIALLQLRTKVSYKPHIRPICVLLHSDWKARVDTFTAFGTTLWGLNEPLPFQRPRVGIIRRLHATECSEIFGAPSKGSEICASFASGASCHELGSPLVQLITTKNTKRNTLFGIQSFGTSKMCVFTDITSYVDWILENMLEVEILNYPKN